jgi:hypothetical protein
MNMMVKIETGRVLAEARLLCKREGKRMSTSSYGTA